MLPTSSELSTVPGNLYDIHFFRFANTQAGVLILLGLLVALLNSLSQLSNNTSFDESKKIVPAIRARVTGRLSKE